RDSFNLVQPMLRALRSGDSKLMAQYEDMTLSRFNVVTEVERVKKELNTPISIVPPAVETLEISVLDGEMKPVAEKSEALMRKATKPPLSSDSLPMIVKNGSKNGWSAYQSLFDAGFIKDVKEFWTAT